ncbi:MAG: AmmeMemoRadiSam system protein B, partial [Planctomycetota bacterium]|nr:AmmeMemoRadiSam system protein B [Planctomycetota bacterium]
NHRDRRPHRPAFAVAAHDSWETPLGEIPIDRALSEAIVDACPGAELDTEAHSEEHAIELQLPFLQVCNPKVKIVAISVGTLNIGKLERLGEALAETLGSESLLVASSDMTHYEPREIVFQKDKKALEKIEEFDSEGLLDICAREEITMCGRGPVAVMLKSCLRFGANNVKVLCHDTSKSGNDQTAPVVGYAALAVY